MNTVRTLQSWVNEPGALAPSPENEVVNMLLDEAGLDTMDLVRLYRAVTMAAEYIDFIGPGAEGHHVIEVRVNEAWSYMREGLRQEEVRVLMNLVRPHLRRWHPGAEPEVRIKSAFGTS